MPFRRIRQILDQPRIEDVSGHLVRELEPHRKAIVPGASIAIACGSRGIANISGIVRTTVNWLKHAGAQPFIVPAMGSHGGATAEGQLELLASYGITEEDMQCPIRSSMDVVPLPREDLPNQVWMDRNAWESDGVIVINRIKPHTDFHGPYESGLAKMTVIGLGKEKQASEMHRFGVKGLRDFVPETARCILATGKILLGIGIVENALDQTAFIEVIPAKEIMNREPQLLDLARRHLPKLPVDELDVLIVDQLGKNISGTGMDTNIIGRIRIPGQPEPETPAIRCIVVRDLTDASHGNATGMGLADVVTRRFAAKINERSTFRNIVTSGFLERGKLPPVAETDEEALDLALRAAGCQDPKQARIIRIQDTLHLGELTVSEPVWELICNQPGIESSGSCDLWD